MSVKREWLSEFRLVPRKIKTGWFSSEIVQVLQQKYHDTGEYSSPEDSGAYCPLTIDKTGWDYVKYSPCTIAKVDAEVKL